MFIKISKILLSIYLQRKIIFKNYKKALVDFDKAILIDSQKQIGLIGKGDCLRLVEKY
jgi:hypothetical protein